MTVPQLPDEIWETIFSTKLTNGDAGLEDVYPIMFNSWSYNRFIHNVTDLDWLVEHGFVGEYGNGPVFDEDDWTPSEEFWW